ncbi:hypothetical protein HRbin01_01029 [archaeon HR01]|nr:hypothetical protein HRbin01_01029 [archaeon HR01]
MLARAWTDRRIRHLREMAGVAGKSAGEPVIASMGSTAPPNVEEPFFIRDHIVCDGAQVTRPSIDPYREPVSTYVYLPGLGIRLSQPLILTVYPEYPPPVARAFVRAAYNHGLLVYIRGRRLEDYVGGYAERILADISYLGAAGGFWTVSDSLDTHPQILLQPSKASHEYVSSAGFQNVCGVIVDEDAYGSDTPIEVSVSLLDRTLKQRGLRDRVALIASSRHVRGSDDIFKLVGLGADAVSIGDAAVIAADCLEHQLDEDTIYERVENLILAIQKEVKLLAGAAGVSRIFSTLVGNRELFRSIGLRSDLRLMLGVKQAGVG